MTSPVLTPESGQRLQRRPITKTMAPEPLPTATRALVSVADPRSPRRRSGRMAVALRSGAATAGWALLGLLLFALAWQLLATKAGRIPTPLDTAKQLQTLLGRALTKDSTHGTGVGLQLWASLGRVFKGFTLAAVIGIPIGLLIGSSNRAWKALNPIVQLLRPVSPLAWFPIWLVVFKNTPKAAVFVILITALWPIVINTAAGAQSVPVDHRNVAKVFRFGPGQYVRHVLLPDAMPGIVIGLRTSMGVAWMVIVAVEMPSDGTGIGFYVWDAYNASNLAGVTAAIVLIGVVGVVLDVMFVRLGRRVSLGQ